MIYTWWNSKGEKHNRVGNMGMEFRPIRHQRNAIGAFSTKREVWERPYPGFNCCFILKRLYVHKMWTLNYIANVHDPVGNIHDFLIIFFAMSTNFGPLESKHKNI